MSDARRGIINHRCPLSLKHAISIRYTNLSGISKWWIEDRNLLNIENGPWLAGAVYCPFCGVKLEIGKGFVE